MYKGECIMLDLVIKNGRIVDGTGTPWVYNDIGIKGDRIVQIGQVGGEAVRTIDAHNLVVAPGFIDMHSHSDLIRFYDPLDEIKLQQGVTTEVTGNCGLSPAPLSDETTALLKSYGEPIIGKLRCDWNWHTYGEYLNELSKQTFSCNIVPCIGSGSLRIAAKGFGKGPLCADEMGRVKHMLSEGLEAGAMGLSMGLMYAPECYYLMDELKGICTVAARYGILLTTHVRGEGASLVASVKEVIHIAESTGIPLNISHFKAAGVKNWGGVLEQAMGIVEDARARGVDITCDVYPYTAGSTSLPALLPPWAQEGGIADTISRLKDKGIRGGIRADLLREHMHWDNPMLDSGWDRVYVSTSNTEKNRPCIGKSLSEIAALSGKDPVDSALDLIIEENGNIAVVIHQMSDEDVKKIIAWDKSIIVSDSLYAEGGNPHPRMYGTFPRLFRKYVREDRVLTIEKAVRKVTSLPAERFGINGRGLLKPGFIADITIFDPDSIKDTATYENPRQYPIGFSYVIVGGKVTIEMGRHTGAKNGSVIRKGVCI
jgi:N-acyl-D-amino-acid deacylase